MFTVLKVFLFFFRLNILIWEKWSCFLPGTLTCIGPRRGWRCSGRRSCTCRAATSCKPSHRACRSWSLDPLPTRKKQLQIKVTFRSLGPLVRPSIHPFSRDYRQNMNRKVLQTKGKPCKLTNRNVCNWRVHPVEDGLLLDVVFAEEEVLVAGDVVPLVVPGRRQRRKLGNNLKEKKKNAKIEDFKWCMPKIREN